MPDPSTILKQYWRFDRFRPLQEEVIHSVLAGHDTLALMPTGGGKSVCYQVPALCREGLCLVISPLIALMKDQVESLRRKQITAYAIFSGMTRREVEQTLKVAGNSNCKFLYVSPERLETTLFKEYLPGLGVSLIAVDEAHCISQWGYDFRPPYLRIAALREELPGIPVLALTASATPDVQKDICDKLHPAGSESPDHWKIFRQSFERPNLSYSVFRVEAKIDKLKEVLRQVPGSSIVYCRSRKRTQQICELLQWQGISVDYYHAGLTSEERSRKQEAWVRNEIRVMVCTNAFGMGIDKPDVRTVIHADVTDCLENYYQEAGRAGRDGRKAYAVLLYDEMDLKDLEKQAALRFPTLDEIRNVYQGVANYLQLPTGSGEGQYYDFEFTRFTRQFGLGASTALYALKTLEQDGWMAFNEQVFLPATAVFTCDKDHLFEFERSHPVYSELVKTLLRAYEGIFDRPTPIAEQQVASLLRQPMDEVKKGLLALRQWGIVDYQPAKDNPQVYLLRPRIKAEDLRIDMAAMEQRKQRYLARMRQMLLYVKEEKDCRSRMIGHYFGDEGMRDCGVCDNCLRRRAAGISRQEWETAEASIISLLSGQTMDIRSLLESITGIKKEKLRQVLEHLQAEAKIEMDATGRLRLK